MESVDATRDLLAGVLETYLSQTSNRMNRVMKQLSIVATVALPLIVLGGIFGMNFSRMPLVHDPLGFWAALAAIVVVSAGIIGSLHHHTALCGSGPESSRSRPSIRPPSPGPATTTTTS